MQLTFAYAEPQQSVLRYLAQPGRLTGSEADNFGIRGVEHVKFCTSSNFEKRQK